MPGPFLHILLAKSMFPSIPDELLKRILCHGKEFLVSGSLGPDLPYASIADDDLFLNNRTHLADMLHTERTNEIIINSFRYIKNHYKVLSQKEILFLFSFFTGYITHIIADGILHPFVRDKVGDYNNNKDAHRIIEMKMDVICFYYFTKRNLNSTIFINDIKKASENNEISSVSKLFSVQVNEIYGVEITADEIPGWISGFHRMLHTITGSYGRILKKSGLLNDYLYPDISDLLPDADSICNLYKPADRQNNFLSAAKINLIDDCIPRFYRIAVPIITKVFHYIFNNGIALNECDIPPVNLDTGRLIYSSDPEDVPFFWKDS